MAREVAAFGSVGQRLRQAFARATGLALAAFGVTLAARLLMLGVHLPASAAYHEASRAARLAHDGMLDEETGLRAWLLTHDERFLEPFVRGVREVGDGDARLGRVLSREPELGEPLLQMRVAQQAWVSEWANRARATPPDASADAAFVARGKELFDAYRARESALSSAIDARLEATARSERTVSGFAAALELALFGLMLAVLRREHASLRRALVEPIERLLAALGRVRDGAPRVELDAMETRELQQLADGVASTVDALTAERARSADRAQESADAAGRLRRVLDMARDFAGSLNLRYVVRTVGGSSRTVGGYATAVVWLLGDDESTLRAVYSSDGPEGTPRGLEDLELGRGLAGRAARYGRAATLADGEAAATVTDPERPPVAALALPMIVGARVVGVIELTSPAAHAPSEIVREVLETLASHAATAVEAARLHEAAEAQSLQDPLTRLSNRRKLEADLANECGRATRYGRPLALVMFDVDHFKRFNDTLGHPRGDAALQEVARLAQAEVRATDGAYRYGGEEFTLVLPETDAAGARDLVERLRARIEAFFAPPAWKLALTASFGVATFAPREDSPATLVERADRALYDAKHSGRNRVVVAG